MQKTQPRTEQIMLGGVWGHRALDGCSEDGTNIFLLPWRTTGFDYMLCKHALVWFPPQKARADVLRLLWGSSPWAALQD